MGGMSHGSTPAELPMSQRAERAINVIGSAGTRIAAGTAAVLLLAWLIPAVGEALPTGWELLKAPASLVILLLAGGLIALERPGTAHRGRSRAGLWLVAGALAIGLVYLSAHIGHLFGSRWLEADASADALWEPTAPQEAIWVSVLASAILLSRLHGRRAGRATDVLSAIAFFCLILFFDAQLLGATELVGDVGVEQLPSQATVLFALLFAGWAADRVRSGAWRLLAAAGPLGLGLRVGIPILALGPLLVVASVDWLVAAGVVEQQTALPLYAVLLSGGLSVLVVLWVILAVSSVQEEWRRAALTDPATGLLNVRGIQLAGGPMWNLHLRTGAPVSAVFLDLDGLKAINDELGHLGGNRHIDSFVGHLTAVFRSADLVGRFGGDEFLVLLLADARQATTATARLTGRTAADRTGPALRFSFGIASAPADRVDSLEGLFELADRRMYAHKAAAGQGSGGGRPAPPAALDPLASLGE